MKQQIKAASVVKMSIRKWIDVPDNPRQRDTESRARKAMRYLSEQEAVHFRVSAARMPNGEFIKLDGHTRAYLWKLGTIKPALDSVGVDVYEVNSTEEAKKLYGMFDSSIVVESATDKVSGAFREHGINPESTALHKGITTALQIAEMKSSIDVYKTVGQWKKEITLLDKAGLSAKNTMSGEIAAALMSLRKYGEPAIAFWISYRKRLGEKNGHGRCGVQWLTEVVTERRLSKSHLGRENNKEICAIALECVNRYMGKKVLQRKPSSIDLRAYFNA